MYNRRFQVGRSCPLRRESRRPPRQIYPLACTLFGAEGERPVWKGLKHKQVLESKRVSYYEMHLHRYTLGQTARVSTNNLW